jgi:hypothetical protein
MGNAVWIRAGRQRGDCALSSFCRGIEFRPVPAGGPLQELTQNERSFYYYK